MGYRRFTKKNLSLAEMLSAVRSDTTPYAKQNGGQFNFIFDGHGNALPDDQVIDSIILPISPSRHQLVLESPPLAEALLDQAHCIFPLGSGSLLCRCCASVLLTTRWLSSRCECVAR